MSSVSFGDYNHGLQVGHSSGSIHAEIHLPPERPETPPSPLSTVPFPRDPEFVTRDTLLHQIHEKASVPEGGSRIALVGLGGVGKSQLAIEYSYQIRSRSPATWVFWVHASNEARFEQSFRDIADQIKIYGRQDPKINIFNLVENRLRDEKLGKWVCILDNVDDDKFLCSLPAAGKRDPTIGLTNGLIKKPLLEYIPRSQNGSIIITSRTREVALRIVDHKGLIEVKPMQDSEALELLQRKLELEGESQESQQLVEELEFMPLAIIQAACYIKNRAPRFSVSQYLADFRKSDRAATRLLKKEAGHLHRDWEAKNSIMVTWQISFDYIRRTKPSAADLLSLMSFFDRQGIPESLLHVQDESKRDSSSEFLNDTSDEGEFSELDVYSDFEENVLTLRDYSFISIGANRTTFTMHRLVQLTMRMWLKAHGQVERWKKKLINNLYHEFQIGEYEDWEKCRLLFPHVKSTILQRPQSLESRLQWATLLYKGAWYASESGKIVDAKEMALKSRKQRMELLSAENEEVLEITAMLAKAYWQGGLWEEAEKLQLQVMEISITNLGKYHPDTLASMANLASTYRDQGRWKEAEKLEVQVMEARKVKLGEDHPATLTSMGNLASTLMEEGRWVEAENLDIFVMETRKMKLGEGHPDTLRSMANLAVTYSNQGRWEEAERLDLHVVENRKAKLGYGHPDTLTSMASLAVTYWNQGRWKEAERLQLQVIDISKRKLGDDHPDTLTSIGNLASTYGDQGHLKEAEKLQVQVWKTRKTRLGLDHPDTLASMANLVSTYTSQGQFEEAEKLGRQVMEMSKAKLGEDHPDTLRSISNLASTLWSQGRWEEAEKLDVHVMETRKTKLGEDHPDTLKSMGNLASTLWNQGRWEEAEKLDVEVMKMRNSKLGEDHPSTLMTMVNLAYTWKSLGRGGDALDLLRECLTKQERLLGPDHPDTLASYKILLEWAAERLSLDS